MKITAMKYACLLLLLFPALVPAPPAALPPTGASGGLTIDQLIDIRHPSNPMWTPDGRSVVFVWDRAGVSKVFVAAAAGGAPPRELREAGPSLNGASWSADGKALLVPKSGDLWLVPIDGSAARAVWTTPEPESNIVASPDGTRVAFVRGGAIVVRSLADGHESSPARHEQAIGGLGWSPDGQQLIYTAGAHVIRHEQTPAYSGSKIIYTINQNVPGQTFTVPASGGVAKLLPVGGGGGQRR
jgi:Tol biopolymer transport system component